MCHHRSKFGYSMQAHPVSLSPNLPHVVAQKHTFRQHSTVNSLSKILIDITDMDIQLIEYVTD